MTFAPPKYTAPPNGRIPPRFSGVASHAGPNGHSILDFSANRGNVATQMKVPNLRVEHSEEFGIAALPKSLEGAVLALLLYAERNGEHKQ